MGNLKNRHVVRCFYKFLKTYKIEKNYLNNFYRHYIRHRNRDANADDVIVFVVTRIQSADYHGLIRSAFPWGFSREGTIYWSMIDSFWGKYVKKNNILY